MITRQTKIQLVAFAIIAVVGLVYTGITYAGLGKYFVSQGYKVAADFPDSGGIFKGAEVNYRGVRVGKVMDLALVPNGVKVNMRLDNDVQVPRATRAVVANRSAVGEQFVDLQPEVSGAPYLTEGMTITKTEIPIQPTQLLVNLDKLVNSVDTKDLGVLLNELGKAFTGAGPSLSRLIDQGDLLTKAASDNINQTIELINKGKTVLDTQRDTAGEFKSFNKSLASLTTQLRKSDPDFRSLFANGTRSATQVTDLIESNRTDFGLLVANLDTVAQVQKVRLPGLRQILVTYPNVAAGGYTVTPGDGTAHFGIATTQTPGVCVDGYGTTKKRDPSDLRTLTGQGGYAGPNLNAYCAAPESTGEDVRGAVHTPRPPGIPPFPADRRSPSATPTVSGAALTQSLVLGDYDPASGRALTSDGTKVQLGSSAGSGALFGDQSWQWMLLGPLTK